MKISTKINAVLYIAYIAVLCILYIVLFSIISKINGEIGAYFVYCKYMNRNKKLLLKKDIKQHLIIENVKWLQMLKA